MPILALVYISLPIIVSIYSHSRSLIKRSQPFWFIAVDSVFDFIVFALFAGYWCRGIVHTMGVLAPCLFLFALALRLGVASRTIRGLPEQTWRVLLDAFGLRSFIIAGAILYIPLYSLAGMAAFRNYDGT